jgi:hypothetical protein
MKIFFVRNHVQENEYFIIDFGVGNDESFGFLEKRT